MSTPRDRCKTAEITLLVNIQQQKVFCLWTKTRIFIACHRQWARVLQSFVILTYRQENRNHFKFADNNRRQKFNICLYSQNFAMSPRHHLRESYFFYRHTCCIGSNVNQTNINLAVKSFRYRCQVSNYLKLFLNWGNGSVLCDCTKNVNDLTGFQRSLKLPSTKHSSFHLRSNDRVQQPKWPIESVLIP